MPRVSILLPAFNAASTLERAVKSILQQTFEDWELLLIDDGSTDGTKALIEMFASNDKRVRPVFFPENRGIVAALNAGWSEAKGEYIARMDADDESHPDRLQKQAGFLDQHPGIALVASRVRHGGDGEAQKGYALYIDWINSLLTPEEIFLNRFVESPFAHPSVMFRKKNAELFGMYREGDFPEDYELWLRWLEQDLRMAKLPDVLLTWHDPPARLSRTGARYSPEAFHRCKSVYLAEHLRRHVLPSGKAIWLCGAGRVTRQRSAFLREQKIPVAGYVDVDAKKIGKQFDGLTVISLEGLPPAGKFFAISYVGNRGARAQIRSDFAQRGLVEGTDFLFAQ